MKKKLNKNRAGFSLVEALLSSALLSLLLTIVAGAVIYGSDSSVVSGDRNRALYLAEEGIEAVRNIRDSGFANLTNGTWGLITSTNIWSLSGSSNTIEIFNRSVQVGSIDANTKSVTSTVSWMSNSVRNSSVSVNTRITNWLSPLMLLGDSILIYGDGTNIPKFRTYDATPNTFSIENSTLTNNIGRTYIIRTSPSSSEAIAGFVTSAGVLNVMCFDGLSWTQEWTTTVGGTGTTRPFDISYETNTGDAVVLYGTNTTVSNELGYRTKTGSLGCGSGNWSAGTTMNAARTNGIVEWVKMAWDKRTSSNLITAIWADNASLLSSLIWSGSAWVNEPATLHETTLERVSASQDVEDFDVEYESLSGNIMVVWARSTGNNGTNGVRYRRCTGGISLCTWGAITTPPTFRDDATNLDISASPTSDQIVFASIGNAGSDLQIGFWNGASWTNTANADTSCGTPIAGSKLVSTGWLVSGGTARSVIRYVDSGSNDLDWYVGNAGTFTKQTDFAQSPATNGSRYFDIQMDPLSQDQLLSFASDSANDLFAKRLRMTSVPGFTWTNSDGSALSTILPQSINSPFSSAFWRK